MAKKKYITETIKNFLEKQSIIHVATCDKNGKPNVSCKGPLKIVGRNTVYFLDLFSKKTRNNLKENNKIAIEVVDLINYEGYQLKGTAELLESGSLFEKHKDFWSERKNKLLVDRIIRSLHRGFSHAVSEKDLPHPKYLVKVTIKEIYDLVPK